MQEKEYYEQVDERPEDPAGKGMRAEPPRAGMGDDQDQPCGCVASEAAQLETEQLKGVRLWQRR
jgi:hypothetical protein